MARVFTSIVAAGVAATASPVAAGPASVRYADEAGSTHVTIMSITPWEAVRADLQPKFPLTEAEALAKVIPSTALSQKRALDVVALTLQAAAPTVAQTTVATSKTDTDGVTTTNSQTDTTRASGDLSQVAKPDLIAGTASGLAGAPDGWVATGSDPMLTYLAAAALKQEAALISRYIEDAAIAKGGRAFVVRLQVSNLPLRRNLPYDVYTNISFLDGDLTPPQPDKNGFVDTGTGCRNLGVMPLLVTDNLEGILSSDSTQNVRQLGLSLLAMLNATGLSVGARKTADDLEQRLGKDLNSLFTVGKLSNDTVRVRFGASSNTTSKWSMAPRTQNVSLVVVAMPCGQSEDTRAITAVARTDYINAISGKPLPQRPAVQYAAWRKQVLGDYGLSEEEIAVNGTFTKARELETARAGVLEHLVIAATDGKWETFRADAAQAFYSNSKLDVTPRLVGLYSDFAAWKRVNRFSHTLLKFDMTTPVGVLPPTDQTVLLSVGKAGATARLQQGGGLANRKLGAQLVSGATVIPASSVTTSSGGATVEASFPALTEYGLTDSSPGEVRLFALENGIAFDVRNGVAGAGADPNCLKVENGRNLLASTPGCPVVYRQVKFTAPPPEKDPSPPFSLALSTDMVLAAQDGQGRLVVRAAKTDGKDGPVFLSVSGGDIAAVSNMVGAPLASTDGRWQISAAGSASLSLHNLAPGRTLQLGLVNDKGKAVDKPQTVWILASGAGKKD
ncbi:hypothetical protein [Caulobacter endophyticus]|uniref:Uncharacterized protein n=1 Tax=Caulobacter endophyticus TaxID=2172652 RepID=A0A2T9K2T7_9CAUL|nr:hypothetical protein [Caulobacter endophyticus]PVM90295.1 hypothetical protein DDF67_10215 [Caulobacter endophyticus]